METPGGVMFSIGDRVMVTLRGDNPVYGKVVAVKPNVVGIRFDGMRKGYLWHRLDGTRYIITHA